MGISVIEVSDVYKKFNIKANNSKSIIKNMFRSEYNQFEAISNLNFV